MATPSSRRHQHARDRGLARAATGSTGRRGGPAAGRRLRFPWALVAEAGIGVVKGRRSVKLFAKVRAHGADGRIAAGGECRRAQAADGGAARALRASSAGRMSRPISRAAMSSSTAGGQAGGARGGARGRDRADAFGFEAPVIVRTAAQWADYPPAIPSPRRREDEPNRLMLLLVQGSRPPRRAEDSSRRAPCGRAGAGAPATRSGSIIPKAPAPRS